MNWKEKIQRLLEGQNASELSRRAGLPPAAISNAVNRAQLPRVDKAIKIAKALNIQTDWLFDDSKEWPPPPPSVMSSLPDAVLAEELIQRKWAIKASMESSMRQTRELNNAIERFQGDRSEMERIRYLGQTVSHVFLTLEPTLEAWTAFGTRFNEASFQDVNIDEMKRLQLTIKQFIQTLGFDPDQGVKKARIVRRASRKQKRRGARSKSTKHKK